MEQILLMVTDLEAVDKWMIGDDHGCTRTGVEALLCMLTANASWPQNMQHDHINYLD